MKPVRQLLKQFESINKLSLPLCFGIGILIYIAGGFSIAVWLWQEGINPKSFEVLIIIWAISFYGGGPIMIAIVIGYTHKIIIRLYKIGLERLQETKE